MAEHEDPHQEDESMVEQALARELLNRLDELELEHVTLAIHQVDCTQSSCTHTLEDLDPPAFERAEAAIHAERIWRDQNPPPGGQTNP